MATTALPRLDRPEYAIAYSEGQSHGFGRGRSWVRRLGSQSEHQGRVLGADTGIRVFKAQIAVSFHPSAQRPRCQSRQQVSLKIERLAFRTPATERSINEMRRHSLADQSWESSIEGEILNGCDGGPKLLTCAPSLPSSSNGSSPRRSPELAIWGTAVGLAQRRPVLAILCGHAFFHERYKVPLHCQTSRLRLRQPISRRRTVGQRPQSSPTRAQESVLPRSFGDKIMSDPMLRFPVPFAFAVTDTDSLAQSVCDLTRPTESYFRPLCLPTGRWDPSPAPSSADLHRESGSA